MKKVLGAACGVLLSVLLFPAACHASNGAEGEIYLVGQSNVENTSGVWIDGEYVGYVKELKKVTLIPGKHIILIRQDGYKDFAAEVTLRPGDEQRINVAMEKTTTALPLRTTSTVIISANPSRAAVFVDGLYVGHAGEFSGWGRAMLVTPGAHQIRIALPGYEAFEVKINPQPTQRLVIKTDLLKRNEPLAYQQLQPPTDGIVGVQPEAIAGQPDAMAAPTR